MDEESSIPAESALAVLAAALDGLVAAVAVCGLDGFDDDGLLRVLQDFERLRNRLPVVDHHLVGAVTDRGLAKRYCQGRVPRLLAQVLRIPAAEATRRVRAAEQLGDRRSMLGEPVPPVRPVLATAQGEGAVTPEQVDLVLRGLGKVDLAGFDPAAIARGEATLTGLATSFGPRDLAVCVDRFVEQLDPDGSVPDDQLVADRRHLELRQQRDGSWRGEFRLTGAAGAKLRAVLDPLARPRVNPTTGPDGGAVEEPDERTRGQRWHDAVEEVCDRILRAGSSPDSGGIPATVVVTIDETNLRTRTGVGTTSDGTRLSVASVLALAEQAEVIPTVLNRSGAVLTAGRSRRIASRAQTLALLARDRGCSFPGCAHPPEYCERHHIKPWIDGGRTDLDLTLVAATTTTTSPLVAGTAGSTRTACPSGCRPATSTVRRPRSSTPGSGPPWRAGPMRPEVGPSRPVPVAGPGCLSSSLFRRRLRLAPRRGRSGAAGSRRSGRGSSRPGLAWGPGCQDPRRRPRGS